MARRLYFKAEHRHDRFKKQLDGSRYQGTNCTCASGGMNAHRHTHGKQSPTSRAVRAATFDTSGGTNLAQVKAALGRLGISGFTGPYYGMAMRTFYSWLRGKRGGIVQGASIGTYGTRWSASATFKGNHAWYCSAGKSWSYSSTYGWRPAYLQIFDPLADGRANQPYPRTRSPFWLPRVYFEKFCRYLNIGGRTLGSGRVYVLFTRVTWRHTHRRYGGTALSAPISMKLKGGFKIRSSPGGTKVNTTLAGDVMQVWQRRTDGPLLGGSRVWYGDHTGTRWVHASARA